MNLNVLLVLEIRHSNNNPEDRVYPKMSPTISLSGMYQKLFINRGNMTNSQ